MIKFKFNSVHLRIANFFATNIILLIFLLAVGINHVRSSELNHSKEKLNEAQYIPMAIPDNLSDQQKRLWVLFFGELPFTFFSTNLGQDFQTEKYPIPPLKIIAHGLKNNEITVSDLVSFFDHPQIKKILSDGEDYLLNPQGVLDQKYANYPLDIYQEYISYLQNLASSSWQARPYTQQEAERMATAIVQQTYPADIHLNPGESQMKQQLYKRSVNKYLDQETHARMKETDTGQLIRNLLSKLRQRKADVYRQFLSSRMSYYAGPLAIIEITDKYKAKPYERLSDEAIEHITPLNKSQMQDFISTTSLTFSRFPDWSLENDIIDDYVFELNGKKYKLGLQSEDGDYSSIVVGQLTDYTDESFYRSMGSWHIKWLDLLIDDLQNYKGLANINSLIAYLNQNRRENLPIINKSSDKLSGQYSSMGRFRGMPKKTMDEISKNQIDQKIFYLRLALFKRFQRSPVKKNDSYFRSLDKDGSFHSNELRNLSFNDIPTNYVSTASVSQMPFKTIPQSLANVQTFNSSIDTNRFQTPIQELDRANNSPIPTQNDVVYQSYGEQGNRFYNLSFLSDDHILTTLEQNLGPPELIKKEDSQIRLVSKKPITPVDGIMAIPSPDNHQIAGLHIYDKQNKRSLIANRDYEIIYNHSNPGYLVKILRPQEISNDFLVDVAFKVGKATFDTNKIFLKLEKVLQIIDSFAEDELIDLRTSLKQRAKSKNLLQKLRGKQITISDLSQAIAESSFYENPTSSTYPKSIRSLRDLKDFIKNGEFHGQCDSCNIFFKQILKEYFQADPTVKILTRIGFLSTGPHLGSADLHAQTVVNHDNKSLSLYDSTANKTSGRPVPVRHEINPSNSDGTTATKQSSDLLDQHDMPTPSLENIAQQLQQQEQLQNAGLEYDIISERLDDFSLASSKIKDDIFQSKNIKGFFTRNQKKPYVEINLINSLINELIRTRGEYSEEMERILKLLASRPSWQSKDFQEKIQHIFNNKSKGITRPVLNIVKNFLSDKLLLALQKTAKEGLENKFIELAQKTKNLVELINEEDIKLFRLRGNSSCDLKQILKNILNSGQ